MSTGPALEMVTLQAKPPWPLQLLVIKLHGRTEEVVSKSDGQHKRMDEWLKRAIEWILERMAGRGGQITQFYRYVDVYGVDGIDE